MQADRVMRVMVALAKMPAGATVGQILRELPDLSRGQGERILNHLIASGLVRRELLDYRKGIVKKCYYITEEAINLCELIVLNWDNCHQLRLK